MLGVMGFHLTSATCMCVITVVSFPFSGPESESGAGHVDSVFDEVRRPRHIDERQVTQQEGMAVDRQARSGARPELTLVDFGSTATFAEDDEESWQERALCSQTDPEAFFPEKGGSTREAKKICTGCEVKVECLEYALANDERFGIWGGLSERERRRIKREAILG